MSRRAAVDRGSRKKGGSGLLTRHRRGPCLQRPGPIWPDSTRASDTRGGGRNPSLLTFLLSQSSSPLSLPPSLDDGWGKGEKQEKEPEVKRRGGVETRARLHSAPTRSSGTRRPVLSTTATSPPPHHHHGTPSHRRVGRSRYRSHASVREKQVRLSAGWSRCGAVELAGLAPSGHGHGGEWDRPGGRVGLQVRLDRHLRSVYAYTHLRCQLTGGYGSHATSGDCTLGRWKNGEKCLIPRGVRAKVGPAWQQQGYPAAVGRCASGAAFDGNGTSVGTAATTRPASSGIM